MSVAARPCRPDCAACCIAPSINSPLPGMPAGKPAGIPCIHLDAALRCALFGRPERPGFCAGLRPSAEMCGDSPAAAIAWLAALEHATAPPAATASIGPQHHASLALQGRGR